MLVRAPGLKIDRSEGHAVVPTRRRLRYRGNAFQLILEVEMGDFEEQTEPKG